MSERLYEALEICLQALETGADPGSVLERFPDLAADLRPLLESADQARRLAIPDVPGAALRRGKTRLLQHAAGMRAESGKRGWLAMLFPFPRLAVSLAMALVFIFSGTGLVRASGGALPGDQLYPVKRTWEDVRLLLAFNPEGREELESEFDRERLHEVDELLAEGRDEPITFSGIVTEQNGDLWVVSGVKVQITPESRMPVSPVTPGTAVSLRGRTNAQGFVEAEWIEILGPDVILPASQPAETETPGDISHESTPAPVEIEDGHQTEEEPSPSSEQDQDKGDSEEKQNDKNKQERDRKDTDGSDKSGSGEGQSEGGKDGSD